MAQEFPMAVDVPRKAEGVLPAHPFCRLGVAILDRLDELQIFDARPCGQVAVRCRRPADGTAKRKKPPRRLLDRLRAARSDPRRVKAEVEGRVLVRIPGWGKIPQLLEYAP